MKILITNYHLDHYAGSELYTYDLARTLKVLKHEVVIFTLMSGRVSERIKKSNIRVVSDLQQLANEKFDIIHSHHNICAVLARIVFPSTPIVFLSHGIIPEFEKPPSVDIGIAKYLAVSEEVKTHLMLEYSIKAEQIEIVRNFVDTDRFQPAQPINPSLEKVLVISNHYHGEQKDIIEKACTALGVELEVIGQKTQSVWDVENKINQSDLVLSLGRGVLQAMACNREVIIFDYHGSDGIVREKQYYEIRKNNFSGRRYGSQYSIDSLVAEMKKYDPALAAKNREIILEHHSQSDIIKQLERVYAQQADNKVIVKQQYAERELQSLARQISNINTSNFYLQKKIEYLETGINEIYSSTAWKIAQALYRIKIVFILKRHQKNIEKIVSQSDIPSIKTNKGSKSQKRVLILSHDYVDKKMAGPGIRYFEMAQELSANPHFNITLAIPNRHSLSVDGFSVITYQGGLSPDNMKHYDVLISQHFSIRQMMNAVLHNQRLILDLYDPIPIEHFESVSWKDSAVKKTDYTRLIKKINMSIQLSDLILCSSERQKAYWLGFLSSLHRASHEHYDNDKNLSNIIKVIPFGIMNTPATHSRQVLKGVWPGIGKDDKVILWGGGIWNWSDPLTLIHAINKISIQRKDVKLFFMGIKRPNPNVKKMEMVTRAIELSKKLGIYNKYVFFNEDWVDYFDRSNYLKEADIGLSLHFENLETNFSFRTRILDYLWAELPIVATKGDYFASLIQKKNLGVVVDYKKINEVALAIQSLLKDEKYYRSVQDNIREIRGEFAWTRVFKPLVGYLTREEYIFQRSPMKKLGLLYRLLKLALYTRYVQGKISKEQYL